MAKQDAQSPEQASAPENSSLPPDPATVEFSPMTPSAIGSTPVSHTTPYEPSDDAASWPAIAGYEVLGELGRGGMGVVYRCLDIDLQRHLAVKVLQEQFRDDADLKRRLLDEARIMGRLQHPGVAPVHEVGHLPDGRPFFSMKQVRGRTLAHLLKDVPTPEPASTAAAKEATAGRTPAADLARLLAIFEQVCQAVAYAHSQGILHRDLKPGNVMVGAFGEVQVMDWGLAKLLKEEGRRRKEESEQDHSDSSFLLLPSSLTQVGTVLGTFAYMAPEQARGETGSLDERCDVFGLGAILCHILTGRPPYVGQTTAEVQRQTLAADLKETWKRLDDCGADGELVALARQCMAARREERLPDGGAVAAALARHHAAAQERLRKSEQARVAAQARAVEERKRRRIQGILAVALVVLVVGLAGAGMWAYWQWTTSQLEEAAQALQRQELEKAINDKLEAWQKGREDLHRKLDNPVEAARWLSDMDSWQAAIGHLREVWKEADALRHGGQNLLRETWAARLEELEQQTRADEDDYQLARRLDDIRLDAATLVKGEFDTSRAGPDYDKVFGQFQLRPTQAAPAVLAAKMRLSHARYALVAALDHWASVTKDTALQQRLLELARRADPDPGRDQLRDPRTLSDQAKLLRLARAIDVAQQSPQFLSALSDRLDLGPATELLERARPQHPQDFWLYFQLGGLVADPRDKVGYFQAALALRPRSSAVWNNLGYALAKQEKVPEAMAYYVKAIELDPRFVKARYNLATALIIQKHLPKAQNEARRILEIDPDNAHAHFFLGVVFQRERQLDRAITHYQKALGSSAHTDSTLGKMNGRTAHTNLGMVYYQKNDLPEAIEHFRTALRIDESYGEAHYNLGMILAKKHEIPEAVKHLHRALELNPKDASPHNVLGLIQSAERNDLEGAARHFHEALKIDPRFASAHNNLGMVLRVKKDTAGALRHFRQSVALDPNEAIAQLNLALVLAAQKDQHGAELHFRKAIALAPSDGVAHGALGMVLIWQGQLAQARQETAISLQLLPPDHPKYIFGQKQLQWCDELLALEQRRLAIQAGQAQPNDPAALLELAKLCHLVQHHNAAATNFYAAAFAAQPELAALHRYSAAAAAALAADGQGQDAQTLTSGDKGKLRRQALTWLRADLKGFSRTVAAALATEGDHLPPPSPLAKLSGQSQRPGPVVLLTICDQLQTWQNDPDLASLRDDKALAKLGPAEQQDCRQFWRDVRALEKQARGCFTERSLTGRSSVQHQEQVHDVQFQAGTTYVCDLESAAFDPFLRLTDDRGQQLAENGDIAPGAILKSRIVFTPRERGTYRLIVGHAAFQGQGAGTYVLRIRAFIKRQ
jgi:tetratricopeptide (TPR) repeat protein/tRNA A-37 threonylcarbamoyl transferase component Bud32